MESAVSFYGKIILLITLMIVFAMVMSGCATSVSYKKDGCQVKMNGLFFAHGLSVPLANECQVTSE